MIGSQESLDLKKVASQAWSAGDKVYWDNTNKEATKTVTADTRISVATHKPRLRAA